MNIDLDKDELDMISTALEVWKHEHYCGGDWSKEDAFAAKIDRARDELKRPS
jgi:hypothetical protein